MNRVILTFFSLLLVNLCASQSQNEQETYPDYVEEKETIHIEQRPIKFWWTDLRPEYDGSYKRRYLLDNERKINYPSYRGVKVSSNEELELLLKYYPDCEAISITNTGRDTFALTEQIGEFRNLKYFEVVSARITRYPKSIENLTLLEQVRLEATGKEEIEFSFSKLKNLKYLWLDRASKIKAFPYTIFDCENLVYLGLWGFEQVENNVLYGIERLVNLKELRIYSSALILPNNVDYRFRQLETLIYDRIKHPLPEYFYSNKTIKNLALSGTLDTLDLSKLSEIQSLENLHLSYQRRFTGNLTLPKLEHLEITDFGGSEIEVDLSALSSLESIVVWSCDNITELPKISNSSLRSVVLVHNDKLESVIFDNDNLDSIEEIIVGSNDSLISRPSSVNGVIVKKY